MPSCVSFSLMVGYFGILLMLAILKSEIFFVQVGAFITLILMATSYFWISLFERGHAARRQYQRRGEE